MEIRKLHEYPEYEESCASILNDEWKRSLTARLHSLRKSCENYPMNLVLVMTGGDENKVIGHSRVSNVVGKDKSCLIESVVVKRELRGKGFGKELMLKSEDFAKRNGFKMMYLSTHDKQQFYQHLGYQFCEPIVTFGSNLPEHLVKTLVGIETGSFSSESNRGSKTHRTLDAVKDSSASQPQISKAPPPPALSPPSQKPVITRWDPSAISWMKKTLE